MNTPVNPYVASHVPSPENTHRSGLKALLLLAWFLSIIAIPVTLIYEESVFQNFDRNFRLGWIHLIGPIFALVLPLFYGASMKSKFACFGLSVIAMFFTFLLSVVACIALYGITAT